jgi:tryptophan 2,3-dioxygenase
MPGSGFSREPNHELFVAMHSATLDVKADLKAYIAEVGVGATPFKQHDHTKVFGQLLSRVYALDDESSADWLRLATFALSQYTAMRIQERLTGSD